MKNKYYTENTFDNIYNLWKTEDFKRLHLTENSLINIIINSIKDQKIGFYYFSNEKLERFHMTLWMNHIAIREYDNPYIHDLYLFHELYHIATLPKNVILNFEEWREAMWLNELKASLTTEVFIYHWHPELRKHTFKDEIWFDYLLKKYGYQNFNNVNLIETAKFESLPKIFNSILNIRQNVRNGKKPENEHEKWFSKYNNYKAWFERWRENYIEVQEIRNLIINDKIKEADLKINSFSTNNIPFMVVLK